MITTNYNTLKRESKIPGGRIAIHPPRDAQYLLTEINPSAFSIFYPNRPQWGSGSLPFNIEGESPLKAAPGLSIL